MDETAEKAVWTTAYVNDLPDGSFLYVESGEKDGEGKTTPRSKRHFPYKDAAGKVDLPHLRNAIARIPQSNAPGLNKAAVQAKARRILADAQKEKGVFAWLKSKLFGEPELEPEAGEFTVWKEAGQMHWLAVYSNNYRDDDHPPEIISKAAHQDFVDAVDAGEWPAPELWYWHIPGARLGSTQFVAFDADSGMSLAAGTIDKGLEPVVERIQATPHLVSHGMPVSELRRDESDGSVIVRYRSRELSLLPAEAAANKHTAYLIKEGEGMNIPQEKLDKLAELGFDASEIAAKLEQGQEEAKAEERESKELEPEEVEVKGEAVESKDDVANATEETIEVEPESEQTRIMISSADLAEAVASVIRPYLDEIKEIKDTVAELSKPPEPEPEAENKALDLTPAASLAMLIKSAVIGQEEAVVDGRKTRHDAPKETKAATPRVVSTNNEVFNTTLNDILDPDGRWMQELPFRRAD